MPPRSSTKRKSHKQARKSKNLTTTTTSTTLNHHSSPTIQFQGGSDLKVLRDQNGRIESQSLRPDSEKCAVEEEKGKKKAFSVSASDSASAGRDEMEGSLDERLGLEESKKVEESQSEDKEVIDGEEEKVKSVVESGEGVAAEIAAETQSGVVVESEESSVLVESEKVEEQTKEASEHILSSPTDFTDTIKEQDDAESKLEESQEDDLPIPEETEERLEKEELPPSEETSVPSSALANKEAVETVKADEDTLASPEEKNELSSVETTEVLKDSYTSLPPSDVVPKAIEETSILKPDESEESKLPAEDEQVEEQTLVVQDSMKEVYVPDAETTSSTAQEKTEIPRSTDDKTDVVEQRHHTSWRSCCGLFDLLSR